MKALSTPKAPAAIGPYSQAIQVGNLVYTSGQIPIDPATGIFAEGGIKEQTRQSLSNIKAILEEAGLRMSNVVKTTVYLADMNDFADMNAVYASFFSEPYPARSAVAVKTDVSAKDTFSVRSCRQAVRARAAKAAIRMLFLIVRPSLIKKLVAILIPIRKGLRATGGTGHTLLFDFDEEQVGCLIDIAPKVFHSFCRSNR